MDSLWPLLFGFLLNLCVWNVRAIDFNACDGTINHGSYTACYWLPAKGTATWQDAEEECSKSGGHVIAITSQEVHDLAMSVMRTHSLRDIWLGIREETFPWRWINTFAESKEQGCYNDDPNDPDFSYSSVIPNNTHNACVELCAKKRYIYAGTQLNLCWCGNEFGRHEQTDSNCNKLCEGEITQVCGGEGANQVFTVSGVFSYWEVGQPNNHQGYQVCTILDREYGFRWNDVVCREWQGSICQVDVSSSSCDQNMTNVIVSQDSCFIVDPVRRTWFRSREHCVNLYDGELARINNMEEQQMIQDYLNKHTADIPGFWIGLIRAQWHWSTGDDMIFTNWDNGRPNGQVKYQSCTKMASNGFWDDTACEGEWAFLCQTDNATRVDRPDRTVPPPVLDPETTEAEKITTTEELTSTQEAVIQEPMFTKGELSAIISSSAFVVIMLLVILCKCWIHRDRVAREKRFDYFFGVDLPVSSSEDIRTNNNTKNARDSQLSNGSTKKKEVEFMSTTVEITPDITNMHISNDDFTTSSLTVTTDVSMSNGDVSTVDDVKTNGDVIKTNGDIIQNEDDLRQEVTSSDNTDEADNKNSDSAYDDSMETLDLIADLDNTSDQTGIDNRAMIF